MLWWKPCAPCVILFLFSSHPCTHEGRLSYSTHWKHSSPSLFRTGLVRSHVSRSSHGCWTGSSLYDVWPLLTSAAFSHFWHFWPRNLNLDCGWSTVPVVEHHASTLQVSSKYVCLQLIFLTNAINLFWNDLVSSSHNWIVCLNGLVVWFLLWVLNAWH